MRLVSRPFFSRAFALVYLCCDHSPLVEEKLALEDEAMDRISRAQIEVTFRVGHHCAKLVAPVCRQNHERAFPTVFSSTVSKFFFLFFRQAQSSSEPTQLARK